MALKIANSGVRGSEGAPAMYYVIFDRKHVVACALIRGPQEFPSDETSRRSDEVQFAGDCSASGRTASS